jgi:outer membrane receptor protein involved in Fe transport
VLAVGNRGLGVEKTRTVEVGYSGVVRGRTWVTADYYRSASDNFISDLVPQLGSPLGRTNPDFGPWRGPDGLPQSVVNRIQQTVPTLSNTLDGSNALVVASYGTFGKVDTQGVDLGVTHVQGPWTLASSYSWFDFDIHEGIPGFERFILPNTPTHKASASASYVRPRWDAGAALRWADSFRWSAGRFQGNVLAYATVDLAANVAVREHVRVGVNIANVLNSRHWESFGGDLLRRRALTHVAFTW